MDRLATSSWAFTDVRRSFVSLAHVHAIEKPESPWETYSGVTARAGSLSRTPARLRSSFEARSLRWRHEPQEEEAAAAVAVWLFSRLFVWFLVEPE